MRTPPLPLPSTITISAAPPSLPVWMITFLAVSCVLRIRSGSRRLCARPRTSKLLRWGTRILTAYCSPLAADHTPPTAHHSPLTTLRPPLAADHPPPTTPHTKSHPLRTIHHTPHTTCHLLLATCYLLLTAIILEPVFAKLSRACLKKQAPEKNQHFFKNRLFPTACCLLLTSWYLISAN